MQSTTKSIPDFDRPTIRSLFAQVRATERGCWEWIGYRDRDGYGVANVAGQRYRAHRVFFESFVSRLDPGLVIDHLCRNAACVNPMHLEEVTIATNTLRGVGPSAENATVTHCPQGHAYTEENTYLDATSHRHCRTCSVTRTRAWRAAKPKRARTHCKRGHEWTGANIRVEKSGVRRCRLCHEEYEASRNAKRRLRHDVAKRIADLGQTDTPE